MEVSTRKILLAILASAVLATTFWGWFFSLQELVEVSRSASYSNRAVKNTLSCPRKKAGYREEISEDLALFSLLRVSCSSNANCNYGFVCLNGTCQGCTQSSECDSIQLICDTSTNQCKHKPLSDFTWRDGLTFGIVFITAGLSSTGGVGGGFLFVPILVLLTGFQARRAAALSQALVAGGSGANAFYGLITRHPFRERPRIDYYVVTVFMATILCGTSVGVILNMLFPNFFTLFMLALLVAYVFYVSIKKAIRLWKEERASWRAEYAQNDRGGESPCPVEQDAEQAESGAPEGLESERSVEEGSSIQMASCSNSRSQLDLHSFSVKSENSDVAEEATRSTPRFIRILWIKFAGFLNQRLGCKARLKSRNTKAVSTLWTPFCMSHAYSPYL
ncbi:hypothetical protein F1559_003899 [Cyanidiococcus yangmingshanensis]|uniref:Sulfite exporter TauE/SafE n=1 Tax=Cyanidiococcus yangmingshanensis TaxID=2690220 RepID=A0A7J7INU7_9RHOD|nr:hypothetical protein F1559_003899 [Cyanidiococcus yangmingshanensis]